MLCGFAFYRFAYSALSVFNISHHTHSDCTAANGMSAFSYSAFAPSFLATVGDWSRRKAYRKLYCVTAVKGNVSSALSVFDVSHHTHSDCMAAALVFVIQKCVNDVKSEAGADNSRTHTKEICVIVAASHFCRVSV